jgi:Arc/MetJ family transcription regulator
MRTTITIEDELFAKAAEIAGPGVDKADVIREAVKTYVRVHAAKRLALLGGSAPTMADVPRRKEGAGK